jgi:SAM-dependent methyltransferase
VNIFPFKKRKSSLNAEQYDPVAAYQRHLDSKFKLYGDDRELAFADAVGSITVELFKQQGDAHVAVLRHHGLVDGMSVFDLGCGCGRTAQALQRSGWRGSYIGTDIIPAFVAELQNKCLGYQAHVHNESTVLADDDSLDLLYHWSLFTHLSPESSYLSMEDTFRALKRGGKLIF